MEDTARAGVERGLVSEITSGDYRASIGYGTFDQGRAPVVPPPNPQSSTDRAPSVSVIVVNDRNEAEALANSPGFDSAVITSVSNNAEAISLASGGGI